MIGSDFIFLKIYCLFLLSGIAAASVASYNRKGLFYVLTLDNNNDKTAATHSKIRNNKYFKEIENDLLLKSFRFIFQSV